MKCLASHAHVRLASFGGLVLCSKHNMTGGAERVSHNNSPQPPLWSLGYCILLGTCQITTFV